MSNTGTEARKPKADALNSLRSISEVYGMAWNDNTMLALCTAFIDGLTLGDAFHQHCLRAAQDSSNDAEIEPADDDGPGTFEVDVCRVGYGHRTLRIQADSRADAEAKALDEAGNHSYSENNSDYTVEGVTRVNEKGTT